jgi:hypothetical protein
VSPSIDVELRRPTARFAGLALLLGALAVTAMCLPINVDNVPPQFRMLPVETRRWLILVVPWAVLLIAAALGAVAIRVARSTSFRIVVENGLLRFPLRTGRTTELRLSDVASIGCNAAGDHLVILAKSNRYLLPWYVMPPGKSPREVAQEISTALR